MVQMTVDHPDYWEHPGAVQYELDVPGVPESEPLAHMIYEPDLQNQQGLPPQYDEYSPVPHLIVVDTSQPPRLLDLLRDPTRCGIMVAERWSRLSSSEAELGRSLYRRNSVP